ncbi:hypothetical protein BLNAU_18304 [Blattamonas nauphoetae]|uniref:Uncharacterized protein n=1 Tax=Blattamonas nauphoetae TaxID=2049346 RepID=A0ABQ9X4T0_9EUKA|nr:hypothetical protein BLNAU_18304 [Blattamonas nauphoetae]
MLEPNEFGTAALLKQYQLIRVYVLEPAKPFLISLFHNSDKLILDEQEQTQFEIVLSRIHRDITRMEHRSDEHDTDFVSELVKWEVRTMVEMENERAVEEFFKNMLNRTQEWKRDKPDRQKRREVVMREEGWDDAFELRVVGIEADTNQSLRYDARQFRRELTFNAGRH